MLTEKELNAAVAGLTLTTDLIADETEDLITDSGSFNENFKQFVFEALFANDQEFELRGTLTKQEKRELKRQIRAFMKGFTNGFIKLVDEEL